MTVHPIWQPGDTIITISNYNLNTPLTFGRLGFIRSQLQTATGDTAFVPNNDLLNSFLVKAK
jgi:hypothetical protein